MSVLEQEDLVWFLCRVGLAGRSSWAEWLYLAQHCAHGAELVCVCACESFFSDLCMANARSGSIPQSL